MTGKAVVLNRRLLHVSTLDAVKASLDFLTQRD